MNGRLSLKSKDLQDILQLCEVQKDHNDPFLRHVGISLTIFMYTQEDLELLKNLKNRRRIILHVDATGFIGRLPKGFENKKLFYYSAAVKLNNEILELFRFLTTEHGIESIS